MIQLGNNDQNSHISIKCQWEQNLKSKDIGLKEICILEFLKKRIKRAACLFDTLE